MLQVNETVGCVLCQRYMLASHAYRRKHERGHRGEGFEDVLDTRRLLRRDDLSKNIRAPLHQELFTGQQRSGLELSEDGFYDTGAQTEGLVDEGPKEPLGQVQRNNHVDVQHPDPPSVWGTKPTDINVGCTTKGLRLLLDRFQGSGN
ncbi:hypothetical protein AC20117_10535 [Arthrobacter crystallopoietes]|nr:hypothetical protein [Arthrobacter crystallopoietes]AUI51173.1 hypothetical protein AC20117_10535 [Arthrobacter crystallopoietes]